MGYNRKILISASLVLLLLGAVSASDAGWTDANSILNDWQTSNVTNSTADDGTPIVTFNSTGEMNKTLYRNLTSTKTGLYLNGSQLKHGVNISYNNGTTLNYETTIDTQTQGGSYFWNFPDYNDPGKVDSIKLYYQALDEFNSTEGIANITAQQERFEVAKLNANAREGLNTAVGLENFWGIELDAFRDGTVTLATNSGHVIAQKNVNSGDYANFGEEFSFDQTGNYTLVVRFEDQYGNVYQEKLKEFTVYQDKRLDVKKPEINSTSVKFEVQPLVSDANFSSTQFGELMVYRPDIQQTFYSEQITDSNSTNFTRIVDISSLDLGTRLLARYPVYDSRNVMYNPNIRTNIPFPYEPDYILREAPEEDWRYLVQYSQGTTVTRDNLTLDAGGHVSIDPVPIEPEKTDRFTVKASVSNQSDAPVEINIRFENQYQGDFEVQPGETEYKVLDNVSADYVDLFLNNKQSSGQATVESIEIGYEGQETDRLTAQTIRDIETTQDWEENLAGYMGIQTEYGVSIGGDGTATTNTFSKPFNVLGLQLRQGLPAQVEVKNADTGNIVLSEQVDSYEAEVQVGEAVQQVLDSGSGYQIVFTASSDGLGLDTMEMRQYTTKAQDEEYLLHGVEDTQNGVKFPEQSYLQKYFKEDFEGQSPLNNWDVDPSLSASIVNEGFESNKSLSIEGNTEKGLVATRDIPQLHIQDSLRINSRFRGDSFALMLRNESDGTYNHGVMLWNGSVWETSGGDWIETDITYNQDTWFELQGEMGQYGATYRIRKKNKDSLNWQRIRFGRRVANDVNQIAVCNVEVPSDMNFPSDGVIRDHTQGSYPQTTGCFDMEKDYNATENIDFQLSNFEIEKTPVYEKVFTTGNNSKFYENVTIEIAETSDPGVVRVRGMTYFPEDYESEFALGQQPVREGYPDLLQEYTNVQPGDNLTVDTSSLPPSTKARFEVEARGQAENITTHTLNNYSDFYVDGFGENIKTNADRNLLDGQPDYLTIPGNNTGFGQFNSFWYVPAPQRNYDGINVTLNASIPENTEVVMSEQNYWNMDSSGAFEGFQPIRKQQFDVKDGVHTYELTPQKGQYWEVGFEQFSRENTSVEKPKIHEMDIAYAEDRAGNVVVEDVRTDTTLNTEPDINGTVMEIGENNYDLIYQFQDSENNVDSIFPSWLQGQSFSSLGQDEAVFTLSTGEPGQVVNAGGIGVMDTGKETAKASVEVERGAVSNLSQTEQTVSADSQNVRRVEDFSINVTEAPFTLKVENIPGLQQGNMTDSKTVFQNINGEQNVTAYKKWGVDFIERNEGQPQIPGTVTLGQTEQVNVSVLFEENGNVSDFQGFENVTNNVALQGCTQQNHEKINLGAGETKNLNVNTECQVGQINPPTTQETDSGYKAEIPIQLDSSRWAESNLEFTVEKTDLPAVTERKDGSLEVAVNGKKTDITINETNSSFEITVQDDFGNSSLEAGTHTATFTYDVDQSGASYSYPDGDVEIGDTDWTVPVNETEVRTFTLDSEVNDDTAVSLIIPDSCEGFQIQEQDSEEFSDMVSYDIEERGSVEVPVQIEMGQEKMECDVNQGTQYGRIDDVEFKAQPGVQTGGSLNSLTGNFGESTTDFGGIISGFFNWIASLFNF